MQPTVRRRGITIVVAVYWLALVTSTHLPTIPRQLDLNVSDKLEHYLAYAGLSFLMTAWVAVYCRLTRATALAVVVICAAFGAVDELTQPLVGRGCDILDWRSDAIGSATGALVFATIRRFVNRIRNSPRAVPPP